MIGDLYIKNAIITESLAQHIAQIHQTQRDFFATHATRPIAFRIKQLKRLRAGVQKHERRLLDALHADLHKGATEAYFSEIGITQSECSHALANVRGWARPQRIRPAWVQLPSSCWICPEPLGTTLIVAPWNYPVQLVLTPLVGALAAGNTVVLKPSEFTPHVSAALAELVRESFDPRGVALIEGDAAVSQQLAGAALGSYFLYGQHTRGPSDCPIRRSQPNAHRVGTGRQKPVHCGCRGQHRDCRESNRLGQVD